MDSNFLYYLVLIVKFLFILYGLALISIYTGGIFLSYRAVDRNKKKSRFLQVNDIVSATDIPSVTLVAPAYNEGLTIVENVKSLLALHYPFYDLIVVNDGSTDQTMELLIDKFDLVPFETTFNVQPIPTATVNKIYKSKKQQFKQLTIIDKNNGGKADAINAGINFSESELILCTDADCIIEQSALLKLVRPYLEEGYQEIIACGGAIGVANDSLISNGTIQELRLPKNMIPMIQVVEYMRAFLIGRMGWGEVNGLMLVSGAFGMYPRNRLIEVGGYDTKTVGEDFDLCIRLRVHMENLNKPYKIVYVPETLCWTEAPNDYSIFIKQRDRWARGLVETLSMHKGLFLNPRYRNVGIFFIPYWVLFEFGAPLIEFLGFVTLLIFSFFGLINWTTALLLLGCVYLYGCIFSSIAIFFYIKNFKHYSSGVQIVELLLAAYLEPIVYHPFLVYAQIKGYYKILFNIKSGWGVMTRKGFTTSKA